MDDQAGGASQGGAEVSWGGGDGGGAPVPPIFGNASATAGDMDFKGVNLDDVFSGVLFSPDGDLLDIPSDDEGAIMNNLTLSSGTSQFAQFAFLDRGGGGGGGGGGSSSPGIAPISVHVKAERQQQHDSSAIVAQAGVAPDKSGTMAAMAPARAVPAIGAGRGVGGGVGGAVMAMQQELTPGAAAADAERAAMAAAAAAAKAAAEARAAQEKAISKAAAAMKAAAAHAELCPSGATAAGGLPGQQGASAAAASISARTASAGGGLGFGFGRGLPPSRAGIGSALGPGPDLRPVGSGSGVSGRPAGGGGTAPRRQRHKVSSKDLTEEQRIERRERNREHAKRSRVRKKFLLDSLQRSVDALQAENDSLKGSIIDSLGDRGRVLVAKCVPDDMGGLVTANPSQATKILDDPDYSLVKALQTAQQNFVITDASLPDNPIVFASGGFLELTGYKLKEVLGRNCRFLQGPETDPRAVDKIRKAIEEGADTSVCLLNYRADMTTFWNQFFVAALRDSEGTTVNYVGVQCKVGDDYARLVVGEQNRQLAAPTAERRDASAPAPSRARLSGSPSPRGPPGEAEGGAGVKT